MESEIHGSPGLLERARGGDAEAFGHIHRAHATRLLRQAMALCGNEAMAEELAQDTIVEAWRSLRRYNGRCAFFTWLCAILLNRYRNTVRSARLRNLFSFHMAGQGGAAGPMENLADCALPPDEAAELRDQNAVVQQCIASLPAKQRQVIHLRFYVDDSLEGIAAALGCSVGTVKSRLFHALEKLRGMNALNARFPDGQIKMR